MAAAITRQARHNPIPLFEIGDGGACGNDVSSTFMGGGAGQFGAHGACFYHSIGVAEGGDGGFEEDVVRAEGLGGGALVDFVGGFELGLVSCLEGWGCWGRGGFASTTWAASIVSGMFSIAIVLFGLYLSSKSSLRMIQQVVG